MAVSKFLNNKFITKCLIIAIPFLCFALGMATAENTPLEGISNNVSAAITNTSIRSKNITAPTSTGTPADELYINVSFVDTLKTILFLSAAWVLGNLSRFIGLPGLVGEICTGFLLGPPLLDFCPFPRAIVWLSGFNSRVRNPIGYRSA